MIRARRVGRLFPLFPLRVGAQAIPKGRRQRDVLSHAHRLGANLAGQAQAVEQRVDLGLVGPPGTPEAINHAPEVLPPVQEDLPDDRVEPGQIADLGPLGGVGDEANHGGIDLRARPEDAGRESSDNRRVADRLNQYRQGAVGVGIGLRQHPLGQFQLDRRDDPARAQLRMDQEVADDRRGGVIRQVRHQFEPPLLARRRSRRQPRPDVVEHLRVELVLPLEGIAAEDPDVGHPRRRLGRQAHHRRVDIHGDHRRPGDGHQGRQGPRPRPDLQDHIPRPDLGRLQDQVMDIQVDEKVLPEPVLRLDPFFGEKVTQIRLSLARRWFAGEQKGRPRRRGKRMDEQFSKVERFSVR